MKLGYACINTVLNEHKITTNRGMIKRTFKARGLPYASDLALENCKDLLKILRWNADRNIRFFRLSSDLFPWSSEYELTDLPSYEEIGQVLEEAGSYAKLHDVRITTHPGPFNVIASANEAIVIKAIKDLRQHVEIMDLMCLPRSPFSAINIHIGGTYGDKEATKRRFADNFKRLPESASTRLVIENDDKAAQYSVQDLVDIHQMTGATPVTFDYHHHWCYSDPMPEEQALKLASTTWPKGIKQLCHYSSCKKIYEDQSSTNIRAHADYVYDRINDYGLDLDIELEAKAKEKALLQYVKQFQTELV